MKIPTIPCGVCKQRYTKKQLVLHVNRLAKCCRKYTTEMAKAVGLKLCTFGCGGLYYNIAMHCDSNPNRTHIDTEWGTHTPIRPTAKANTASAESVKKPGSPYSLNTLLGCFEQDSTGAMLSALAASAPPATPASAPAPAPATPVLQAASSDGSDCGTN